MSLTYDDVHQLIKEPSPKVRAGIAQKVAANYDSSSFTSKSNKIALDILRLLLKDTEKQVRLVLARELKHNNAAPHDIILSLAFDESDIAEEVLLHSKVLKDSDLLEIISLDNDLRKLCAIARREKISRNITDVLVGSRRPLVVSSLLANVGAEISDASYDIIIEEFANDNSIVELLVCRGGLSFLLAEKLYYLVSERFKKNITRRHLIPNKTMEKVTTDTRESMILKFLSPWMTDEDLAELVNQMYAKKRLTDGLILRALCIGELGFFEAAIAKRVGIPISNARKLLRDSDVGFSAIYRTSKLPKEYKDAVQIMLRLVRDEFNDNAHRTIDFNKRMLEKIKHHKYDISIVGMDKITDILNG